MAKSNKDKVVQMLTPENYIRKKARTLPIFECLVASEWEESGLPTVVIARKHTNGNITACTYLVDLKCLGVKDSSYLFNVSMTQYRDFKEMILENIELTPVDYALAHNIVLGGVEYAEELGFKPYKDYESVTKYMLEEDTDEIELMELECGRNGKPFYIQGPYEDQTKVDKIIAQLEKSVGPGNFEVVYNNGFPYAGTFDEEEVNDQAFWEMEKEFAGMPLKQKKNLLFVLIATNKEFNFLNNERFVYLTNSIVYDLLDENSYHQFFDQYREELKLEVTENKIPDQLLGITLGEKAVSEELKHRFYDLYWKCNEDPQQAKEEVDLFRKAANGIPGACFLELIILQNEESPEYEQQLEKYSSAYPHYALIQLLRATWLITGNEAPQDMPRYPYKAEIFFAGRKSIHIFEWTYFLMLQAFVAALEMNINKIAAFSDVIHEIDLDPVLLKKLEIINFRHKLRYILNHGVE